MQSLFSPYAVTTLALYRHHKVSIQSLHRGWTVVAPSPYHHFIKSLYSVAGPLIQAYCQYTTLSRWSYYAVIILSLYRRYTVTILSLYCHFTVTILSLYCHYTVTIQSLYRHYHVAKFSLHCQYTITIRRRWFLGSPDILNPTMTALLLCYCTLSHCTITIWSRHYCITTLSRYGHYTLS
jgi:hypothetical protein